MRRAQVLLTAAMITIAGATVAQAQGTPPDTTKKAPAPSIEGRWQGTIDSPQGSQSMEAIFKKDGESYTGMMSSPQGEMPLRDIKIEGDKLTFVGVVDAGGTSIEVWYSFTIKPDALSGQADISFNGQSMSFPLSMTKAKSGG